MDEKELQDLTDRVFLLQKQLEDGRVKIAGHLIDDFHRSFQSIKIDMHGWVVPETVDGRIRAMANFIQYIKNREDSKGLISLFEIQKIYFDILETNFGYIRKKMIENKADENTIAFNASRNTSFVENFLQDAYKFVDALKYFWRDVGDIALFHIEDLPCLKAIFGGDLFPSYTKNIASTAGLYVDTIILPCPILQMANLIEIWKPEKAVYYLIKHALSALKYKELALANVNPPIIAVLPSLDFFDKNHTDLIHNLSESSIIKHGSKLFDVNFTSIEELTEFMNKLITPEELVSKLKCPDRLLFDVDWSGTQLEQIKQAISDNSSSFTGTLGETHAGQTVFFQCIVGRMRQAAAAEIRSNNLRGTPLIDAETSWNYLNWKMEYDAKISEDPERPLKAMHVVRALQAEGGKNLSWLGNVPPESIIELRMKNLTEDIRSIISRGLPKIIQANPNNFFRTSDQVVENLDASFRAHQQDIIKARNKKLKLFGLDVPACLAVGGIAVAAAITTSPALGAVAGILGAAGFQNLRDIKSKFKDIREEENKLRTSPTGILFKHISK